MTEEYTQEIRQTRTSIGNNRCGVGFYHVISDLPPCPKCGKAAYSYRSKDSIFCLCCKTPYQVSRNKVPVIDAHAPMRNVLRRDVGTLGHSIPGSTQVVQ